MASKRRSKASPLEKRLGVQGATGSRGVDWFTNFAARMGLGTPNLADAASYELVRFSYDYWQLITLYRNHWISRRICDAPAQDMVRAWPKITTEMEPDDLIRINRALRRTNSKQNLLTALKWAKLFGGAGCLIVLEGQENELEEPLDLDDITPNSYRGLIPFDRWAGIQPVGDICTDIRRPTDFNRPEFYEVTSAGADTFRVHASRVLRFTGPEVPTPEREAQSWWGISVLEPVYEEIKKRDNMSWNILNLTFRANLVGMKFPQLAQMLSGLGAGQEAQARFQQRMEAINHLMSNQSLIPLPADGGIESTQYTFGGLSDCYQQFQLDISGAAQIPVTRLWGRTISGLGQSNDADERIYEERIATDQDSDMRPQLEKLYPILCMSELGEVPEDIDLTFPSVRVLDEKEKAELAKTVVDTVTVALSSGGISLQTYARELKRASEVADIFTTLTDEEIAKLPAEVQNEADVGANMFGESEGGPQLSPAESPQKVLREEGKEKKQAADARGNFRTGADQCTFCGSRQQLIVVRGAAPNKFYLCERCAVNYDKSQVKAEEAAQKASKSNTAKDAINMDLVVVPSQTKAGLEIHKAGCRHVPASVLRRNKVFSGNPTQVLAEEKAANPGVPVSLARCVKSTANDISPSTVQPGDQIKVNGKLLTVRKVVRGENLFHEPELHIAFETGEVVPYRPDSDINVVRAKDEDGTGATRNVHGLECVIETPKGETRRGDGWSQVMPYDYGYLKGVQGADGDSMDVALGPESNGWVYVIDQKRLDGKGFDEHKCFLNWPSARAALAAFQAGHHRASDVYMDWTPMKVDEFKRWLETGDHKVPMSKQ